MDAVKTKEILSTYKKRLVNISSRNKCYFISKLSNGQNLDLVKLTELFSDENSLNSFLKDDKNLTFQIKGFDKNLVREILVTKESNYREQVINHIPSFTDNDFNLVEQYHQQYDISEYYKNINNLEDSISKILESYEKKYVKDFKMISNLFKKDFDNQKDFGTSNLYLGYPFVEGKYITNKYFRAPLVLHKVELTTNNPQKITIKRITDEVIINPIIAFAFFMENDLKNQKFTWSLETENYIEEAIDRLKGLGIEVKRVPTNYTNFKNITKKEYERNNDIEFPNKFKTKENVILGMFPLSSENIYGDLERIGEKEDTDIQKLSDFFGEENYPMIDDKRTKENEIQYITELDYSQKQVVAKTLKDNFVIEGPPGTGKSQVIANIVANYLYNNKKVLVVSEKSAALEVVYNRLNVLSKFALLITNHTRNKNYIYEQIQNALEHFILSKDEEDIEVINSIKTSNKQIEKVFTEIEKRNEFYSTEYKKIKLPESLRIYNDSELKNLLNEYRKILDESIFEKNNSEGYSNFEKYLNDVNIKTESNQAQNFIKIINNSFYNSIRDINKYKQILKENFSVFETEFDKIYVMESIINNGDLDIVRKKIKNNSYIRKSIEKNLRSFDRENYSKNKILLHSLIELSFADNFERFISNLNSCYTFYNKLTHLVEDNYDNIVFFNENRDNKYSEFDLASNVEVWAKSFEKYQDEFKNIKTAEIVKLHNSSIKVRKDLTIKLDESEFNRSEVEDINIFQSFLESFASENRQKWLNNMEIILNNEFYKMTSSKKQILNLLKIKEEEYDKNVFLRIMGNSNENTVINSDIKKLDRVQKRITLFSRKLKSGEFENDDFTENIEFHKCFKKKYKPSFFRKILKKKKKLNKKLQSFYTNLKDAIKIYEINSKEWVFFLEKHIPSLLNTKTKKASEEFYNNYKLNKDFLEIQKDFIEENEMSISEIEHCLLSLVKEGMGKSEILKIYKHYLTEDFYNEIVEIICEFDKNKKIIEESIFLTQEQETLLMEIKEVNKFETFDSNYLNKILDKYLYHLDVTASGQERYKKFLDNATEINETKEYLHINKIEFKQLEIDIMLSLSNGSTLEKMLNMYKLYLIEDYVVSLKSKLDFYRNMNEKLKLVDDNIESKRKNTLKKISKCYTLKKTPIPMQQLKYLINRVEKRYMSIPKLINKTFDALYAIFPVWILTPEEVSSLLPSKKEMFDVVLFDEASQMFIERSISSIYRSKKYIIAGDSKQLQPSNFFKALYDDADEEEIDSIEEENAYEAESLLDFSKSKFNSEMLRYHYRSESKELIDFSSRAFYRGKLTFASKSITDIELPIEVIETDGKWIDNKNIKEGQVAISTIKKCLEYRKNNETIGVITFNQKQKEYVENLLVEESEKKSNIANVLKNEMGRINKETNADERLFVKNLENVQGDERDIIIFVLGYARNEKNRVYNNFGPINKSGGENRLNVAITRAKKKIFFIKSIKAEELNPNVEAKGAFLLKKYIQYAEYLTYKHNDQSEKLLNELCDINIENVDLKFDSPFEEEVYEMLVEGLSDRYELRTQIPVGSFRIDLGIYDKKYDNYILGIECDGAAYHSSPDAVENDYYRQKYLESRKWVIHRVWSTNWWEDRENEINKILMQLNALEQEVENISNVGYKINSMSKEFSL